MAISRVNTTTTDITGQPFASFGIPTVAAGNSIIICIADGFFNTGSAPSVSDGAGNTYTLQVSAFTGTVGNPNRRNARIWTAFNTTGGASSVFINWGSATNARIHVLEYSGIATSSQVESVVANNSFATPVILGNCQWTTPYSLLLSINADNSTNGEAINGADTPAGGAWTLVSANRATYGGSLGEKIPNYTIYPTFEHQGLTGNATTQCLSTIVILKASLSITLTESVTPDDTDSNDVVRTPFLESFSVSDFVDAVLNGNQRFKNLVESTTLTDTITSLSVFNRTLSELTLVLDTISFVTQYSRTLNPETVRIQDWLSVKKTNSTHWGN